MLFLFKYNSYDLYEAHICFSSYNTICLSQYEYELEVITYVSLVHHLTLLSSARRSLDPSNPDISNMRKCVNHLMYTVQLKRKVQIAQAMRYRRRKQSTI